MFNLILKDIDFNRKQVILGLVATALFSLVVFDGPRYNILTFFMVPALLVDFIVSKGCYMEDKDLTFLFLKSLPVQKKYIVASKYIECIVTLVFSYIYIFVISQFLKLFKLPYYTFDIKLIITIISMLTVYYSMYLFIYFRTNYLNAQRTVYVILIGFFGVYKLQKYLKSVSKFGLPLFIKKIELSNVFLVISLIIFIMSLKMSIKNFNLKE